MARIVHDQCVDSYAVEAQDSHRGSFTVHATTGTPRLRAHAISRGPTSEWCSASVDAPERASSVLATTGMSRPHRVEPGADHGSRAGPPRDAKPVLGERDARPEPALRSGKAADRAAVRRAHEGPLDEPEATQRDEESIDRGSRP